MEKRSAALVLTATTFNPSIITETWLSKNDIMSPDELEGARVFAPEVAQFQSKKFQILITPPRLQVVFDISDPVNDIIKPRHVVSRIVELLSHTPYQALGINFKYAINPPKNISFAKFNHDLFGHDECPLRAEFKESDARFGRYLSKNYGDARLRLSIIPIKPGPDKDEYMVFDFNFHYNLENMAADKDKTKEIVRFLKAWETSLEYCEKLVRTNPAIQD